MSRAITIRGLRYEVEPAERPAGGGKTEPGYRLRGARGADYATQRNVPNPHLLFLVHASGGFGIPATVKGVWLTDQNGELRVVQE